MIHHEVLQRDNDKGGDCAGAGVAAVSMNQLPSSTSLASNGSTTTIEVLHQEAREEEEEGNPLLFASRGDDGDGGEDDGESDAHPLGRGGNDSHSAVAASAATSEIGSKTRASTSSLLSPSSSRSPPSEEKKHFDAEKYLDQRAMSPVQERANAITMIPVIIYSCYFVMAGRWLTEEAIKEARAAASESGGDAAADETVRHSFGVEGDATGGLAGFARDAFGEELGMPGNIGCIHLRYFPRLHALPPLPVLAGAAGMAIHAFFSILYHWKYAATLPRRLHVDHWSRRLDHAFIHFASACMAYATSGRMDYFLLSAVFNLDSAYRQFERRVRPRRNQFRIFVSMLLYSAPILSRGLYPTFVALCAVLSTCGWLFVTYPLGGWSHALFHAVLSFVPHLIMIASCTLPACLEQIRLAATCVVAAGGA